MALYHKDWAAGTSQSKFARVQTLGPEIGPVRKFLLDSLSGPTFTVANPKAVEGAALLLLMSGRIRVGDVKYLNDNGTTGVTTLLKEQVYTDAKDQLFLRYVGKSGNKNPDNPTVTTIEITEPVLKNALSELRQFHPEDPRLFIYESGAEKSLVALSSARVNRRAQELFGDKFSVKDLRTWAANVMTVQERAVRP